MNFSVFVSVLLWNIFVGVEAVFYLELANPSVDATTLIELANHRDGTNKGDQSGTEDGPFNVVLYECNNGFRGVAHHVSCSRPVYKSFEQTIYAVTNFNGVSDLELPPGHSFKIDGNWLDKLPQAVAIGGEPHDGYLEKIPAFVADSTRAKKKVDKFLARFLDSEDDIKNLVKFFSINHKGFLFLLQKTTRLYFARYVTTLQKLINASGYNQELGPPIRPGSPNRSQPQPQTQSKKSTCGYLCRALVQSRIWSRARSGSFRSKSFPWSRSRSKPQSFDKSQFPKSPSRGFSTPQSESESLSNSYLVEAAGMLSFKMFDPCSLGNYFQPETAEEYCAIYCQFLSATMHVDGQIFAKECQYLKTGSCKKKQCACSQRRDVTAEHVNMAHCNNAMRLHIYQQARQSFGPKI